MNRRADFPLLARSPGLHYLDSAATVQKPAAVLDAEREFYETAYANPHRGAYGLSVRATERYQQARKAVARFFGVDDAHRLVFTRGTTESLNLVAATWGRTHLRPGDEIVVTRLEHHANFVPWQQLARERGAIFRIAELTPDGRLDLARFGALLSDRTRVVAVAHISNALGTVIPVAQVADLAHAAGAIVVVDGAQSAAHFPVDVDALGADFFAFSGHKMGAPTGIGGLIGRRSLLEALPPYQMGGDMIARVDDHETTWNVIPNRFEAGTPNVGGAVALAAAIAYLERIGRDVIRAHEQQLTRETCARLASLPGVRVYGPAPEERSGVISFTVDGVHAHDLATILDQDQVCIRAGHHCAHPLLRTLRVPATARASFFIYNDDSDVDALVAGITRAQRLFGTVHSGHTTRTGATEA